MRSKLENKERKKIIIQFYNTIKIKGDILKENKKMYNNIFYNIENGLIITSNILIIKPFSIL